MSTYKSVGIDIGLQHWAKLALQIWGAEAPKPKQSTAGENFENFKFKLLK